MLRMTTATNKTAMDRGGNSDVAHEVNKEEVADEFECMEMQLRFRWPANGLTRTKYEEDIDDVTVQRN